MINRKIIIGVLLVVILCFIGCGKNNKSPEDKAPSQGDKQSPNKDIIMIKEQISNMTLQEKIGQMVIAGFEGYTIDDNTRDIINNYHLGGFILFGRNVEDSEQLLALVNSLKRANSKNKTPLFISVDEEGGRISRMPDEINDLPTNEAIGKIYNSKFSYEIGRILADEVKSFGFNMNFAPVLDINSNPDNPVIGDRAFGSDVNIVSKLGIQTMKGIQSSGVIPVVKHFPGHGDTSVDSHVGLPSINNDIDRLKSFELIPFKEAINSHVDAVMIAHILLNKIDPNSPASLSETIITELLRKQMNFNGVVITDDMTMGAILEKYSIGDAAIKAINAGNDIVLVCHGQDNVETVLDDLIKAVDNGIISKSKVDESLYRILKLKHKYKLTDNIIDSINIEKINNEIRDLDFYLQE